MCLRQACFCDKMRIIVFALVIASQVKTRINWTIERKIYTQLLIALTLKGQNQLLRKIEKEKKHTIRFALINFVSKLLSARSRNEVALLQLNTAQNEI